MLKSALSKSISLESESRQGEGVHCREPKIAIVIVTFNRVAVLVSCIQSLLRIKYKNYAMIVVDNASSDSTAGIVESLFPDVKILRSNVNTGYTGGNNKGIAYALSQEKCDYILILNDDVVVDFDFLNELVNVAEKNPKIGLACSKVVFFENPKRLYTKYGKYNFYVALSHQPLLNVCVPIEIGTAFGTCILAKRELINRIGPLDKNFFLYFDDADLSYRTRKAGYKIVYVPTAKVYHKVSQSYSGWMNPIVLYYITRNELLFAQKHLNFPIFLPLWLLRFVLRITYYIVTTGNIQFTPFMLKGFLDFTKGKFGKASFKV